MKEFQDMVREFHEKAGAVINNKPTLPDCETEKLRLELIFEELKELAEAFGMFFTTKELPGEYIGYTWKYSRPIDEGCVVSIADAIGDLLYVVLGTAVSCGIDIEPIFREIHRSNMSKFIDGYRREDGKWIKGLSYSPANLKPIIEAQVKAESQPKQNDN